MGDTNQPNKGGRPLGSSQTPTSLLNQEIREGLKLQKAIRELISEQVAVIRKELQRTQEIGLERRVEIIQMLAAALQSHSKGMESPIKHVMIGDGEGGAAPSLSGADMLKAMKGH